MRPGIDVGAKVLVVLITLESAILAIMGVSIVAQGGAHGLGFASFDPHNIFNSGVLAVLGHLLRRLHGLRVDRAVPRGGA